MCRISLYQAPAVHVSAQSQDGESKALAVGQVSGCLQVNRTEKKQAVKGRFLGFLVLGFFFSLISGGL